MEDTVGKPSLAKRALALVILVIAAVILLKIVIGFLAGMITLIAVVALLTAVVWAWRTL